MTDEHLGKRYLNTSDNSDCTLSEVESIDETTAGQNTLTG